MFCGDGHCSVSICECLGTVAFRAFASRRVLTGGVLRKYRRDAECALMGMAVGTPAKVVPEGTGSSMCLENRMDTEKTEKCRLVLNPIEMCVPSQGSHFIRDTFGGLLLLNREVI